MFIFQYFAVIMPVLDLNTISKLSSTIKGWDRPLCGVGSCHHPFEEVTNSIL